MALFLQQKEGRSELQERVAAEMKERLQRPVTTSNPGVTPALLEESGKTRSAGVVLVILLAVFVVVAIIWASMQS